MIDHEDLFRRHHDRLAAQHLDWQRSTGRVPPSFTWAYQATEPAAREWFRVQLAEPMPLAAWLVHVPLIFVTLGLWTPFAFLHWYLAFKAREMRYGTPRARR